MDNHVTPPGRPEADDRSLQERICADDHDAIETLLVSQCGAALRYLARKHSYPDLLTHLYLHLRENNWARLRTWQGRSSLRRWVEQVAIRLCLAHLKEMRRFEPLDLCIPEIDARDLTTHREGVERQVLMSEILSAIDRLKNPTEQALLRLHVFQHVDLADVADTLGITRQNADTIKHRAIRHLSEMLGTRETHVDSASL